MVFSDTEQVYYGVSVRRYSGAYDYEGYYFSRRPDSNFNVQSYAYRSPVGNGFD